MKMTNEEMATAVDTMSQLNEQGKLGYAIAKNLRILRTECMDYMEFKNKLLKKWGVKKGNVLQVPDENIDSYMEELGDLPDETSEVEVYRIPEELFLSGSITSKQMVSILWMVE